MARHDSAAHKGGAGAFMVDANRDCVDTVTGDAFVMVVPNMVDSASAGAFHRLANSAGSSDSELDTIRTAAKAGG